jgi:hypothetical protein
MKKRMIPSVERDKEVITLTLPKDVIVKMEAITLEKGMRNYKDLIRFYIGKGLRDDLYPTEPKT